MNELKILTGTCEGSTISYQSDAGEGIDISNVQKRVDDLQEKLEFSSIWQTFHWSEVLLKSGYIQKSIVIYDEEVSVVCFLQKRSLGGGQWGLFALG